jgi:ERCC4-type nuclease
MKPTLRIFFTENQDDSANVIATLALSERDQGASIFVPLEMPEKKNQVSPFSSSTEEQVLQFLLTIPGVSYITASNIVTFGGFSDLKSVVNWCVFDAALRLTIAMN